MKKIISYSITILIVLFSISCKKEKSQETDQNTELKNYIIDTKNSVINWTAFKSTEKIPVKGIFKEVHITKSNPASSPVETLKGMEFEVPVSSIFSNDSIRDFKLTNFFFKVMKNTLTLSGEFNTVENGKGMINLNMNGISKGLPFTYEVEDGIIEVHANMNLDQWNAQPAIQALNEVCNEKHKAADGISKTWNEVDLNIQIATVLK